MRISSLGLTLALAACGAPKADVPPGETVACALDGATQFAPACTAERNAAQITVRHPDGGFRRFEIVTGGAVVSLDGADRATAAPLADGTVELTIGGDRYRLKPDPPAHAPQR